jgi:nucleotide-binding universal stress UspA family protein
VNDSKILFPTDFSTSGRPALELATSLARDRGASLLIVHVEEEPSAYVGGELYLEVEGPTRQELRQLLSEVVPTDPSVRYEHHFLIGSPADAIVQLAESQGVDMIVMPTHGRSGLLRFLMGSVAEKVVRMAKCPVLTLRQGSASAKRNENESAAKAGK